MQISGDVPYISSTKNNIYGIDFKIFPPKYMKLYQNCLTLNNSGSVGCCFYQNEVFVSSDHCTNIWIKDKNIKLNKFIGLFLKPIFEFMRYKYSFGREISDQRLKKEFIKLPINKTGEPDFQFMEDYIKNLAKKINYNKKINFKKTNLLNTVKYRQFNIQDLFKIRGSKKSFTQYEIKYGDYFYITTSNKNNGFSGTSDIFTEKGNIITFDSATEGKCFYQEKNFVGSDHVEILEPKNFTLNRYLGIYFITILNLEFFRYSFGRKRSQKRMKLDTIYLPYTTDKKKIIPNFAFMENYIKSLAYSKHL